MADPMSGELTAHLTTGAVVVYLIEWAKQTRLCPWLSATTPTLNRIVNLGAAGLIALGINWTYDPTMGTLVVHGLTLSGLATAAWELLKQLAVQQVLYDTVVQKSGRPTSPSGPIR